MDEKQNEAIISAEIKNSKVYTLGTILVIGFTLSVIFHYIMGYYLHYGYPYNTFLFKPSDRFNDFLNVYRVTVAYNTSNFPYITYLPFSHVIFTLLTHLRAAFSFVIIMATFTGFYIFSIYRFVVNKINDKFLKVQMLVIISFFSYPLLMVIDRGNIEGIVFVFLGLFFYFYYIKKSSFLSVIFLSLAISMKLYPLTLLILLVSDKKYRETLYTIILTLFINATSLWFLMQAPGKDLIGAAKATLNFVSGFVKVYSVGMNGLTHSHTIWSIISLVKLVTKSKISLNSLLMPYSLVAICFFVIISLYIIFFEEIAWRKVTLLIFSMILLPFNSSDYTLIHVYLPLVIFLISGKIKHSFVYTLLFGLLLIPLDYYYFVLPKVSYAGPDVSISVVIYPLIMLVIIFSIILEGFMKKLRKNQKNVVTSV